MPSDSGDHSQISDFHARLPYGERVSSDPVAGGPFFPFEGDLNVVPLDEPVVPEPPRNGEPGAEECFRCASPEGSVIWRDEHWNLRAGFETPGLPMVAGLSTNVHTTMHTMPPEVAASMGPVIQRVAVALRLIDGVGRTHFSRWGDGSEHFHMSFLARPLGMMQMRGPMLAVWDDLLPRLPEAELTSNIRTVAQAMAAGGGKAMGAGLSG
ncbi:MAG: hypothetical protein ACRDQA_02925 [Nocardioidaceae bacterium]